MCECVLKHFGESMKQNWNFQRGEEFKPKDLLWGVWTAHLLKIAQNLVGQKKPLLLMTVILLVA